MGLERRSQRARARDRSPTRTGMTPSWGHIPNDLIAPIEPHILKVPLALNMATESQAFSP